jgi:hypothetical protein
LLVSRKVGGIRESTAQLAQIGADLGMVREGFQKIARLERVPNGIGLGV